MNYCVPGSLRAVLNVPQRVPRAFGSTPVPEVVKRIQYQLDNTVKRSPEQSAVEFYALNHMVAILQNEFHKDEPLPEWALKIAHRYVEVLTEQSTRMYAYLVLIVTRESRHVHNMGVNLSKYMVENHGETFVNFNLSMKGMSPEDAVARFKKSPPKSSVGNFLQGITHLFNNGKFSKGYGGLAWGKVAQCLEDAVTGKTSLELMVDTAYSLAHNNGPIFNKGMFYQHYGDDIIPILDIQRSGQMLEAIYSKSNRVNPHTDSDLAALVKSLKEHCPKAFGDTLDWVKVKALGAVGDYYEIQSLTVTHQKAVKQKVPPFQGFEGVQASTPTGEKKFFYWPGKFVLQHKRKEAA